ncbi:MAG: ferrochelatase, partial [Acetobacteraceae bacterium]
MPADQHRRVAIVLFNLGGPDRPEAIGPFLRNLFTDPAILRVPFFIRPFLARIIARARVQPATANYALMGGKSPLLKLTRTQADALEAALSELTVKCFIAMRYWHPFARETVREVQAWDPDEIVLLPLYPQFSTTTTGSSLTDWRRAAVSAGLMAPVMTICCYPD